MLQSTLTVRTVRVLEHNVFNGQQIGAQHSELYVDLIGGNSTAVWTHEYVFHVQAPGFSPAFRCKEYEVR